MGGKQGISTVRTEWEKPHEAVDGIPEGPRNDPELEAFIFRRGGFFRRKTFVQLHSLYLTFQNLIKLSKS
jgi:hypothetical protein